MGGSITESIGGFFKGSTFGELARGAGVGMSAMAGFQRASSIDDLASMQYQSSMIQASGLSQAADVYTAQGALAIQMSAYNEHAQNIFAENLLSAGEVDVAEINRMTQKSIAEFRGAANKEMDQTMMRAGAANVAMSGTVLQQLEYQTEQAVKGVNDIQYQGNLASSKALLESQMNASSARLAAGTAKMQGIMESTSYQSKAIEARAQSSTMAEIARYTRESQEASASAARFGAGASLLTSVGKIAFGG